MSTATPTSTSTVSTAPRHPSLPDPRPATLLTRTGIELRKLVDTRSSLWLMATMAGLLVALLASVVAFDLATGFGDVVRSAILPLTYLLPVLGILTMCGEWRHDIALWTYTLDPRRTSVFAAKVFAVIIAAVVATLLLTVTSVASTALMGFALPSLDILARTAVAVFVVLGGTTLIGVALGAAFTSAAPALVTYLVMPTLLPQILSVSPRTLPVAPYTAVQEVLYSGLMKTVAEPEHVAGALAIWIVIPLLVGLIRNARRDV